MTYEEYFNQTEYFSESAEKFIPISEMAYPHAYYAFRKLVTEYGEEFVGTRLFLSFHRFLSPKYSVADLLSQHGKASIMPPWRTRNSIRVARRRFYTAGQRLGMKVKTHWNGKWVEGEVVRPETTVRVKGRVLA